MSVFVEILSFLGFLAAYIGWFWILAKVVPVWQERSVGGKAFWYTQLQLALEVAALFLFIWLLSGFFDAKLTIAWLIASEVAISVYAIFRWLFVSSDAMPGAAGAVAGSEIDTGRPGLSVVFTVMSAVPVVLFPIVAGVAHFVIDSSDDLDRAMVRYTLFFVWWYFVITQPIAVYLLANPNIDEDSRLAGLLARLSTLIPTGLSLAVLLWSMSILGDEKTELSVGALSLALSPIVGIGLIAWFLLGALLPYAIGSRRGKEKRKVVLTKQKEWINKLVEALRFYGTPRFAPALAELDDALSEELADLESDEPLLASAIATSEMDAEPPPDIDDELLLQQTVGVTSLGNVPTPSAMSSPDQEETPVLAPVMAHAFEQYSPHYVPARYYEWLHDLSSNVSEIRGSLETRKATAATRREAETWIDVMHDRTKRIDEGIEDEKQSKTVAIVAAAGLGSTAMSAVMSEFGNWAWSQVVG